MLQSRATWRLRQNFFPRVGGHFAAPYADRRAGLAVVGRSAGGTFHQSCRRKTAAALGVGNGLSVTARIAAVPGFGANAALPGTIAAGQRTHRSITSNRGASAGSLLWPLVSTGGISTPVSASVFGINRPSGLLTFAGLSRQDFTGVVLRAGDNTTIPSRSAAGQR